MTKKPPKSPVTSLRARAISAIVVGGVVAIALTGLRATPLLGRLELPLIDVRTRLAAGERPPDPRIVIVQIGENDVDALLRAQSEHWPWRLVWNQAIVEVIAEAGASAVVVDMFHLDRGAGQDDYKGMGPIGAAAGQLLDLEGSEAAEYGDALKAFGRAVLSFKLDARPTYDIAARRDVGLARLSAAGLAPGPLVFARTGANWPVRRIAEGAKLLGFANADPDPDGVVRRAVVVGRAGDHVAMSLPLAGVSLATGTSPSLVDGRFEVAGVARPLEADGSYYVDFRRNGVGAYARVAPWRILGWAQDRDADPAKRLPTAAIDALKGKIVIFGVNLDGLEDLLPTPVAENLEGPEFQATVLDNLWNGGGRVRAPKGADLAVLFAASILAALLGTLLRGKVLPHLSALLAAVAVVAVAWIAFRAGTILDVATPVGGVALAWGGAFARRAATEGRYTKWLEGTFSRFLAPSVIEAIKHDPSLLELGGRRRGISILFSDVAGFTSFSEKLTPDQVVELLNRYLTPHCDAVFEHGGTIDKFIGDAVMAFYGDPIPQEDHAVRACRSALSVQARLPAFEPVWRGYGLTNFVVRIGINSGEAVVGSMGSAHRSDYTCMGDAVNLASRLEGANKAFGTRILLGASTYDAAGHAIVAKPLGRLGVVGKSAPVAVYELMALRESAPADLLAHVAAFTRAGEAARRGDLVAARTALAEAARLKSDDGPSAWFATLLDRMESGDEPTPWSGTIVLTGK